MSWQHQRHWARHFLNANLADLRSRFAFNFHIANKHHTLDMTHSINHPIHIVTLSCYHRAAQHSTLPVYHDTTPCFHRTVLHMNCRAHYRFTLSRCYVIIVLLSTSQVTLPSYEGTVQHMNCTSYDHFTTLPATLVHYCTHITLHYQFTTAHNRVATELQCALPYNHVTLPCFHVTTELHST